MEINDKENSVIDNLCSYIKYSILEGLDKGCLPKTKHVIEIIDIMEKNSKYNYSLIDIEENLFKQFINETCKYMVKYTNSN